MSEIGDELRKVADERLIGVANTRVSDLDDRIDAEMVELPKDRDGRPIRVGDTVYDDNDREYKIDYVSLYRDNVCMVHGIGARLACELVPRKLAHERPDSLERIADELDELCDDAAAERRIRVSDQDALHKFAERIRMLAEREED